MASVFPAEAARGLQIAFFSPSLWVGKGQGVIWNRDVNGFNDCLPVGE